MHHSDPRPACHPGAELMTGVTSSMACLNELAGLCALTSVQAPTHGDWHKAGPLSLYGLRFAVCGLRALSYVSGKTA